jgi:hypothetical protein
MERTLLHKMDDNPPTKRVPPHYRGGYPRMQEIKREDAAAREVERTALLTDLGRKPTGAEKLLIDEAAALAVQIRKKRRQGWQTADLTRLLVRALGQLRLRAPSVPADRSGLAALHNDRGALWSAQGRKARQRAPGVQGRASQRQPSPVITANTLVRWRVDPTKFIHEVLIDPDSGRPFVLLPAEIAFLKQAFTTDRNGRLKFPELVYAAPKKSGKTTFASILLIYVLVVLAGRGGEAYCVANDFDQAQGRVFAAARRIVEASPLLAQAARILSSRIEFADLGNATITALASDYAGAAGANPNIVVFDELWAYSTERSRRLWDEMVPPPTRKIACRLTVTYAGFEGESELLEELHARGAKQPTVDTDLHAGDGLLMFWSHKPVAPWQDADWLTQMRQQLRPNAFLRMIENRFVTSESTFVDMDWFDACVHPDLKPLISDTRLPVWIGVDASVKRDSTALVAATWDHEANKVRVVTHRIFQPSAAEPLDFEFTVEQTLLDWCRRFKVKQVRYDPYQMQAVAQRLAKSRVPMEEFAQSVPNLTEASTNLYELIKSGNLVIYPDAAIRLAIQRAVAVETSRGWRIAKEKQSHK